MKYELFSSMAAGLYGAVLHMKQKEGKTCLV